MRGRRMQPALFEAVREFVGFQAGCEQKALCDRHTQAQQELTLRFGFHAFGDESQTEAARDARHRLAYGDVGIVVRHAFDEQLAELQAVDRQPRRRCGSMSLSRCHPLPR